MPKVQLKNAELFYEVHGSGPVVAFVHGLTGNHLSWFHQIPEFAKRYRCLVYDQRHFGVSQTIGPDSGDSFVDDLRELIDKVGDVKDVRVIGQSWGGNVALRFGLKYPEMTKALVLAGSEAGMLDRETSARIWTLPPDDPKDPLAINYAPTFPSSNPAEHYLFGSVLRLNTPRPQDFMSKGRMVTPSKDVLGKVNFPTLFITGEKDARTPPVLVKAAQELMPKSKLVSIPNSGHSAFLESHQFFNREVLSFLNSVDGRSD